MQPYITSQKINTNHLLSHQNNYCHKIIQSIQNTFQFNSNPSKSLTSLYTLSNIKSNPFQCINDDTTRDSLFRIVYILQQENQQLIKKIENLQQINIPNLSKSQKSQGGQKQFQQKQRLIQSIKQKNVQYIAQMRLLQLYKNQQLELTQKLQKKVQSIQNLQLKKQEKQTNSLQVQKKLKQTQTKLLSNKQIKINLLDEIKKNNFNSKNKDNQFIDQLLDQYYQTLNGIMKQQPPQKINIKTKQTLLQSSKKKRQSSCQTIQHCNKDQDSFKKMFGTQ